MYKMISKNIIFLLGLKLIGGSDKEEINNNGFMMLIC